MRYPFFAFLVVFIKCTTFISNVSAAEGYAYLFPKIFCADDDALCVNPQLPPDPTIGNPESSVILARYWVEQYSERLKAMMASEKPEEAWLVEWYQEYNRLLQRIEMTPSEHDTISPKINQAAKELQGWSTDNTEWIIDNADLFRLKLKE